MAVRDGRFASAPAAGAEVIDGRGKFLLPGLWEGHTHLRPALHAIDATMGEYVARGITSVLDLGGPVKPLQDYQQRRRGARLFFAGPPFTGIGGWPLPVHGNPEIVAQIADAPSAVAAVRAHVQRRPDVVKLMCEGAPGSPARLSPDAQRAVVEGAHAAGLRVLAHVHTQRDSLEVLEAGVDAIEHSFLPTPGREREEAEELTEALVRTGAYLTPTLATWEQLGRAGDPSYLDELMADGCMSEVEVESFRERVPDWGSQEFPHHPRTECLERLEAGLRMLPMMHAAGVKLAAGSDINPVLPRPAATLRELLLLARAGLPTEAVLLAATRHAAGKIGLGNDLGAIEPGKLADAVLLDANPLEDLAVIIRPGHLVTTFVEGEPATVAA